MKHTIDDADYIINWIVFIVIIQYVINKRHVFTELPKADSVEAVEALLPANIDTNAIYR